MEREIWVQGLNSLEFNFLSLRMNLYCNHVIWEVVNHYGRDRRQPQFHAHAKISDHRHLAKTYFHA